MKGTIMTLEKYYWLRNAYGSAVWESDITKVGSLCVDCSGLISWSTGILRGSQGYYDTALERKSISQIDESMIGWAVWLKGHIGIYVGNGEYIAADGSLYNTRRAKLSANKWTHVLKLRDIDYTRSGTGGGSTGGGSAGGGSAGNNQAPVETITSWMNANGMDSSYANRARLAAQFGISDYRGTLNQNLQLLANLKKQKENNPGSSYNTLRPGNYKLTVNLNVRTGPGTNYPKKTRAQLTPNGQKNSNAAGTLLKGTVVTVQETRTVDGNLWGRIPSGWICLIYKGAAYVIKV